MSGTPARSSRSPVADPSAKCNVRPHPVKIRRLIVDDLASRPSGELQLAATEAGDDQRQRHGAEHQQHGPGDQDRQALGESQLPVEEDREGRVATDEEDGQRDLVEADDEAGQPRGQQGRAR